MDNISLEQIISIVLFILFEVITGVVISMFFILNYKARKLAESHSLRLDGLKKLNTKYHFDMNIKPKYVYRVDLPNKRSFDAFDPVSYYGGLITTDIKNYELLFHNLEINKKLYSLYYNDLVKLPREIPKEICKKHTRVPYFLINRNEKKLVKAAMLYPVTESKAVFRVNYTSQKGRNSYSKEYVCLISQLSADYYQHVVTKNMKDFQRSLMTDSLRYDVLKRDGFRCVLCGRTANDGVVLHVDHIIPIARGGKTEPNNLRTLCEFCNLGKSAKFDPNGPN